MTTAISKGTLRPPPGSPCWDGSGFPLIYLGWGTRDFFRNPLPLHRDSGTNYYLLLSGRLNLNLEVREHSVRAPSIHIFDEDCAFGLSQQKSQTVRILVWIWRGQPVDQALRPEPGGFLSLPMNPASVASVCAVHDACRREVSLADSRSSANLIALRRLMETELLRASRKQDVTSDVRWELARNWILRNLSIQAPVPALCDYLGMSRSTLHRVFRENTGTSPGEYFRRYKMAEAGRLIEIEGWQVKAVAYHLGYRHPNDLSRALRNIRK